MEIICGWVSDQTWCRGRDSVSESGERRIGIRHQIPIQSSNNEAEYEAVLQGLRLAEKARAKRVKAYLDSQLVTQ